MKIINKTYRDISADEYHIQKTPIKDLSETTSLPEGSLIHVVVNFGSDRYESHKMTTDVFKQKIYDSVQNTFKTEYWGTHELIIPTTGEDDAYKHNQINEANAIGRPAGTSFAEMLNYLQTKQDPDKPETIYVPEEVAKDDPHGFVKHIYYDFDLIKRYIVAKNNDIEQSIINLGGEIDGFSYCFSPTMGVATTALDNNVEVVVSSDTINHNLTENDTYCQMSIESGNKISNEWTCPESGNLVIYGWLDSSACLNNKATPSAFCVIEGNINNNWEIISVCPVTPAKNITYVGFNLMVKRGLVIRARTGFVCGVKSGQFPNEQDGYDTLSNSKANGFKCMIYLNKEGTNNNDDSGESEEG